MFFVSKDKLRYWIKQAVEEKTFEIRKQSVEIVKNFMSGKHMNLENKLNEFMEKQDAYAKEMQERIVIALEELRKDRDLVNKLAAYVDRNHEFNNPINKEELEQ